MDADNVNLDVTQTSVPGTDNTVGDIPDSPAQEADETYEEYVEESQDTANKTPEESQTGKIFGELAEKKGFKSVDDLAKAYQELERHTKKVEMTSKQKSPNATKVNRIDQLELDLLRLKEKEEIRDLVNNYEDAPNYMDQLEAYVRKNPTHTWETAYRFVKYEDLINNKQEEKQSIVDQKQRVQTQTARRRNAEETDIAKLIADREVPLADIEKMLS